MTEYIVTAQSHRVTKKVTENGETRTVSTKYKKGDTINLNDADAQRLLRSGGVRKVGDDAEGTVPGSRLPDSIAPVTTGDRVESPGALSGQVADEGLRPPTEPSPEAIAAHQDRLQQVADLGGGTEETPDDGYEDEDYPALQRLARERNLEPTGKKAELIARLREYDAAQEDDNEDDQSGSGS